MISQGHSEGARPGAGIDLLPRIHQTLGIEDALELAHGRVEFLAEDDFIQLGALEAITVLAAHDAAEPMRELGRRVGEFLHCLDAFGLFQVDQRPDVQAAGGRVRVIGSRGVVGRDQALDRRDVLGEMLDRNGDVFDHGDGLEVAPDAIEETETGLADRPDVRLLLRVEHTLRRCAEPNALRCDLRFQALTLLLDLRRARSIELDDQNASGIAMNERDLARVPRLGPGQID